MFRLFTALVLIACLQASGTALHAAGHPNILIILADDLGYSDLHCYGGEIDTPNLDKLADKGLRFTDFHNTGRCWPTRGALMTGYYPQAVRMDPQPGPKAKNKGFPTWTRTLPQLLKPLGYRSYHSGKWHIGCAPNVVADAGFDHSYYLGDHDRHFNPRDQRLDDKRLPPVEPGSGYYTTTAIADHCIGFLKEHAAEHAGEPFFQYLAFTCPHFPLMAPPEDIAKYKERYRRGWDVMREERFERERKIGLVNCELSKPEGQIRAPSGGPDTPSKLSPDESFYYQKWTELTPAQQDYEAGKMAIHAAMIDRMDQETGRVIAQLKAMNQFDNTLILFLSDNGASAEIMVRGDGNDLAAPMGSAASFLCLGPGWANMSNAPFRRYKIWTHEGGTSTPLIVHWPQGIAAHGELRHDPGHVVDLMPTLLDLAGAPRNKASDTAPQFPGRSLLPAFAKDNSVRHDFIFYHHEGNRGLRIGDFKLVSSKNDDNNWELYDTTTDRSEQHNLAPQQPDKAKKMVERWEKLQAQFLEDAAR
ncbi:MAG: atsA 29 [Verrucomicrobiaceae bacterium]|nr:atsA 29 [Verrucomicrobiaceae bacterium]